MVDSVLLNGRSGLTSEEERPLWLTTALKVAVLLDGPRWGSPKQPQRKSWPGPLTL